MQKSPEVHVLLDQKNAEIANLNDALQDSRRKYAELEFKSDETVQTVVQCERDIDALKVTPPPAAPPGDQSRTTPPADDTHNGVE